MFLTSLIRVESVSSFYLRNFFYDEILLDFLLSAYTVSIFFINIINSISSCIWYTHYFFFFPERYFYIKTQVGLQGCNDWVGLGSLFLFPYAYQFYVAERILLTESIGSTYDILYAVLCKVQAPIQIDYFILVWLLELIRYAVSMRFYNFSINQHFLITISLGLGVAVGVSLYFVVVSIFECFLDMDPPQNHPCHYTYPENISLSISKIHVQNNKHNFYITYMKYIKMSKWKHFSLL